MQAEILKKKFNVSEIFHSIQGEGLRAGFPCVFVRLQGCELRCTWCDTDYALDIKKIDKLMTGEEIFEKASSYYCNFITFTGGEPLLQQGVGKLMKWFSDEGFTVAVETNGHQDISELDKRIIKIMDLKCPGSGMEKNNNFSNIEYLTKNDEVKFVLADRADYEWAKARIEKNRLIEKTAAVHLSAVFDNISPLELAEWILEDNLNVRLQLQLHKFIWHPGKRGV